MCSLPSTVTHQTAAQCLPSLEAAIANNAATSVVIDASAIQAFDSSAIAVLLHCRRTALANSKDFAVRGLPTRLQQLAALYGVAQLLPQISAP